MKGHGIHTFKDVCDPNTMVWHRKETYWSSVFTCYQQVILFVVYKVKFETFSFLIMSIKEPLQ